MCIRDSFKDTFQDEVIQKFKRSYEEGLTPNPCIDCNRYIKFSKLIQRALLMEKDYIATGHYARIEYDGASGRYLLKRAVDLSKDQSYVLYVLSQHDLSRTLLPLGGMMKSQVRRIAEERDLINARTVSYTHLVYMEKCSCGCHDCSHGYCIDNVPIFADLPFEVKEGIMESSDHKTYEKGDKMCIRDRVLTTKK